jgi:HlyD family secretion protein
MDPVCINNRRSDDSAGRSSGFVGANPALRTGTFARAIVTLGQSCGIAIPLSGVLYGKEGPVVQVVRGDAP